MGRAKCIVPTQIALVNHAFVLETMQRKRRSRPHVAALRMTYFQVEVPHTGMQSPITFRLRYLTLACNPFQHLPAAVISVASEHKTTSAN